MLQSRLVRGAALMWLVLAGCHQATPFAGIGLPLEPALDGAAAHDVKLPAATAPEESSAPGTIKESWIDRMGVEAVSTVASPEAPKRFISLAECIAIALENGRTGAFFDRTGSERHSSVTGITREASIAASSDSMRVFAFDPGITATEIEQSLARFDAIWNTSLVFNRIDQQSRILAPTAQDTLFAKYRADTALFQTGLLKPLETGGLAGLFYRESYETDPFPPGSNIVNPANRSFFGLSFEQPLLRGAGVLTNQVRDTHPGGVRDSIPAGGKVPGILLARLGFEQSKLEFERRVHEIVFAVEEAYWGLYSAYWELYSRENALTQTFTAWQLAKSRFDAGGMGIEDLAMIEEQYHFFRTQRLEALGRGVGGRPGVLEAERRLRYTVGLPAEDGMRIVPLDSPRTFPGEATWQGAYASARAHRPELREVQQELQAAELLLLKAKDNLKPDLRFFSRANLNGFGTSLGGGLGSLNHYEWEMGLQGQVPIGYREGHAEVTRANRQVAQRLAFLKDQEAKLLFSLQRSYREFIELREAVQIRRSLQQAAATQLKARLEKFRAGGDPKRPEVAIDLLLRAQRNWADAVRDESLAICSYNIALAEYEYQKGTILEYHNVAIAEGPLPCAVISKASHFLRGWHDAHAPHRLPGELESSLPLAPDPAMPMPSASAAGATTVEPRLPAVPAEPTPPLPIQFGPPRISPIP